LRILLLLVSLVLVATARPQETISNATTLWLNQPSAVSYEGTFHRSYYGWVTDTGAMMIGGYDHDAGQFLTPVMLKQWPISDDHGAPAVHVIAKGPDKGKILVAYSLHNSTLFCRRSTNPEDISAWEPETVITTRKSTYPKLVELANGLIYVLFRGDAKTSGQSMGVLKGTPNAGRSWSADLEVVNFGPGMITYPGNLRAFGNRLHILFNVPVLGGTSQTIYHAWRDEWGVWRSAGGTALSLPITQSSMASIYTSPTTRNLVLGDLRLDHTGKPVATWTTSLPYAPPFGAACPAYRGKFTGVYWQVKAVPSAAQVYYPSGLVIDPLDTDKLVSVGRIGGQYELRRYSTVDNGTNWTSEILIRKPEPMTRPLFVENGPPGMRLTWLDVLRYDRYNNFSTNLRIGY